MASWTKRMTLCLAAAALSGCGQPTQVVIPPPGQQATIQQTKAIAKQVGTRGVEAFTAHHWAAYFDLRGKKVLVEKYMPGAIEDYTKMEDWWYHVDYSPYNGPKQRLAITEFENKVPARTRAMVQLASLESLLISEVFKTKRYVLVERTEVDKVIEEQDFGASGRVAKPSAAKIGQILGAQYLVEASITEYVPDAAKFGIGGGGIGGGGGGIIGISRQRAELAINIRIINATTSEIVASVQKRGWAATWGLGTGGGGVGSGGAGGGGMSGFSKTPIGRAAQSCMAKAVYEVVRKIKDKPWQGGVMLVKDDKVYVNAGENLGMKPGMVLSVLSKGEELVDPDTGLVLGSETTPIGSVVVQEVKENYSVATVQDGCEGAKKGDILEFVR